MKLEQHVAEWNFNKNCVTTSSEGIPLKSYRKKWLSFQVDLLSTHIGSVYLVAANFLVCTCFGARERLAGHAPSVNA